MKKSFIISSFFVFYLYIRDHPIFAQGLGIPALGEEPVTESNIILNNNPINPYKIIFSILLYILSIGLVYVLVTKILSNKIFKLITVIVYIFFSLGLIIYPLFDLLPNNLLIVFNFAINLFISIVLIGAILFVPFNLIKFAVYFSKKNKAKLKKTEHDILRSFLGVLILISLYIIYVVIKYNISPQIIY